ncbi:MAG: elongation factor P hydroxylase [Cellvibrionaceae bacterium]
MSQEHNVGQLIELFNSEFEGDSRTQLIGNGEEPLYEPANDNQSGSFNRITFTRDYFSSALHEVAHWCIAGPDRRKQVDYGYWYAPDGRNEEQQRLFEAVEVKPQALEWIFSTAAGIPFKVSADNLNADSPISNSFKKSIHQQVKRYCKDGLPSRAERFANILNDHFLKETKSVVKDPLNVDHYKLRDL